MHVEKIDVLLKEDTNYTVKDIKLALGITSNKDLFVQLSSFLYEKLDTFSYDIKSTQYRYLYKIFKYIMFSIEHTHIENKEEYEQNLDLLYKKVIFQIEKHPKLSRKCYKENEALLKKIKKNIEVCKMELSYYVSHDKPDLYDFMKFLLIKNKNYDCIYESVKNNASIVNATREDDLPLFEILLLKCIQSLKKSKMEDVVFYERVINLFLQNPSFKLPYNMEISKYLESLNLADTKENEAHLLYFEFTFKQWEMHTCKTNQQVLSCIYGANKVVNQRSSKYFDAYKIQDKNAYEDFTDRKVVTLDTDRTSIFDDAFSLEKIRGGYEVCCYVSDVSGRVSIESPLFRKAYQIAESFATEQGVIYPYPRSLCLKEFSLNQDKENYVKAYIFHFDRDFTLQGFYRKKAKIFVRKNYTFDEIEQKLFREDTPNMEMLRKLYDLSKHLHNGDITKRGYHILKEKLRKLEGQYSFVPSISRSIRPEEYDRKAKQIVTELKILTGASIAKMCKENGFTLIYRGCEQRAGRDKIEEMLERASSIPSSMKPIFKYDFFKPFYTTEERVHEGLGKVYCHTTAPIRQVVSSINSLLLDTQLEGKKISMEEQEKLYLACTHLNNQIARHEEYVKQLLYMRSFQNR